MERIRILPAFTLGVLLFSCGREQPDFLNESDSQADAVVDFDYHIEGDCSTPVLEVVLKNKTLHAASYLWNFGDGTSSTQLHPKKVYAKSGNYTIKLTAYFLEDTIQVEERVSIVKNSDGTGPFGQLSFKRSNTINLEFTFEITTEEPSYSLHFGDGSTILSSESMIKHQYGGPGRYSAVLIVQNSEGCGCANAIIDASP